MFCKLEVGALLPSVFSAPLQLQTYASYLEKAWLRRSISHFVTFNTAPARGQAFEDPLPSQQRPPLYVTQPSIPCLINSKISPGAAKYYLYRSVSSVKGIPEWSAHGLYPHL